MIKVHGNQHGTRVYFSGKHEKLMKRLMKMTGKTPLQIIWEGVKLLEINRIK